MITDLQIIFTLKMSDSIKAQFIGNTKIIKN